MNQEALLARDDLNGIATLLSQQQAHLRPSQVGQLLERTIEDCRPFLPAELRGVVDTILDTAAQKRSVSWMPSSLLQRRGARKGGRA
jgi:hypothetical protein